MHLVEPKPRTWSRQEYHQMAELGWFEGQRVELVEGEVIVMSPQNFGHSRTVDHIAKLLHAEIGNRFWVRSQLPLKLPDGSELEPDVSVVAGQPGDYADHPTTALLVIEVSDTTLAFDRTRKAKLYAAAGIPHYWIASLRDRTIEMMSEPEWVGVEPQYKKADVLTCDDEIELALIGLGPWKIAALMP